MQYLCLFIFLVLMTCLLNRRHICNSKLFILNVAFNIKGNINLPLFNNHLLEYVGVHQHTVNIEFVLLFNLIFLCFVVSELLWFFFIIGTYQINVSLNLHWKRICWENTEMIVLTLWVATRKNGSTNHCRIFQIRISLCHKPSMYNFFRLIFLNSLVLLLAIKISIG